MRRKRFAIGRSSAGSRMPRRVSETGAAAAALAVYAGVLPAVRRELRRCRGQAELLADPARRRLALAALDEKRSNSEAVAVFAVTAPRARREQVVRAIVALQVAIDYCDSLEETLLAEPAGEDRYLEELLGAYRLEAGALPAAAAVGPALAAAVERCQKGQRRTHSAAAGEVAALERWARGLPHPPGYLWWELAAGASSSVAAHALIAAAADPKLSPETAEAIDAAYNPPIGALTVFLDDLLDREDDRRAGEHNYLDYYEGSAEAAKRLAWIASQGRARTGSLPYARRHRAILAGVGAFYLSDPAAQAPYAQPIQQRLLGALGPGAKVLATFMRGRRLFERRRPGRAARSPGL